MTTIRSFISAVLLLAATAALAGTSNNFYGVLSVYPDWTSTLHSDSATVTEDLGALVQNAHSYGTSNSQMNALVWDAATVTNGEETVYSLATLTNKFGQDVALTNLCFLAVKSTTNSAGNLVVGNAAAHAPIFGATNQYATVRPGGLLLLTSPIAANSNDTPGYVCASTVIRVANPANPTNAAVSVSYEIYMAGHQ